MLRPPLPAAWEHPIPRTSLKPTKMVLGVPMEVLGLSVWAAAELWMAFGARAWAVAGFVLIILPARYATAQDPFWLEILRESFIAWLIRAATTRGRSIFLSHYRAP